MPPPSSDFLILALQNFSLFWLIVIQKISNSTYLFCCLRQPEHFSFPQSPLLSFHMPSDVYLENLKLSDISIVASSLKPYSQRDNLRHLYYL